MARETAVDDALVWVDMEMTGLNLDKDRILEIAVIVTDAQLNPVGERLDLVLHQPDDLLSSMDQWCIDTHGASGLTEASRRSTITETEAEQRVMAILTRYTKKHNAVLAGNSVHVDRQFLLKYMPKITAYLHYRIVDVSTIKELCKRWYPKTYERRIEKKLRHRALDDILESIEELRWYHKNIMIPTDM